MIGPLGIPEEPVRPEIKPVASRSRFAVVGGSIGGILDAKCALEMATGDYEKAATLLAYLHYGITNSLGVKGRIAGIRLTVLMESDGAEKETLSEIADQALKKIGVPPSVVAGRQNGRLGGRL